MARMYTCIVAVARRALLACIFGARCNVRAVRRRDGLCPEAGDDLEVGTILELVETPVGDGYVPMAFVSAIAYAVMPCGAWVSLGRELGVRLVRIDCVQCAVMHSTCKTLAYRPYVLR